MMTPDETTSYPSIELLSVDGWKDYELLDSGNGEKLERFGSYIFVRPEHQAIWQPALPEKVWRKHTPGLWQPEKKRRSLGLSGSYSSILQLN